MASDIPSIASIKALSGVTKSPRQDGKLEVSKLSPGTDGEALPSRGKKLPAPSADSARVSEAVTRINEIVQNIQRDLSFNMDEDSGQTIIRVIDSESGELIRQIPSEDALAIALQLNDLQPGAASGGEIGQGLLFSDRT